jgi:hypothetical protein
LRARWTLALLVYGTAGAVEWSIRSKALRTKSKYPRRNHHYNQAMGFRVIRGDGASNLSDTRRRERLRSAAATDHCLPVDSSRTKVGLAEIRTGRLVDCWHYYIPVRDSVHCGDTGTISLQRRPRSPVESAQCCSRRDTLGAADWCPSRSLQPRTENPVTF